MVKQIGKNKRKNKQNIYNIFYMAKNTPNYSDRDSIKRSS